MKLGVLFNTDRLDRSGLVSYAERLDDLGFESLWLPELFTRDPFATAGCLVGVTKRIKLASGIANIYARDAVATVSAASSLQELSEGRFLLGLGVSNRGLNERRGHTWQNPVTGLTSYLTAMRAVELTVPTPDVPIYAAAHGPKMLGVAATLCDGANTYLMPVEHTAGARDVLGPERTLNTMLFCLLDDNPTSARATARKAIAYYVALDYYQRAWRKFGFDDSDFADGGSDRLVDSVVAWGDYAAIKNRIAAQAEHGASRVVVLPIGGRRGQPNWALLEFLAADVTSQR